MNDVSPRLTNALSGRYRVAREVGAGGMASVYPAEDVKHKRKIAIKVLKSELAAILGAEVVIENVTRTTPAGAGR